MFSSLPLSGILCSSFDGKEKNLRWRNEDKRRHMKLFNIKNTTQPIFSNPLINEIPFGKISFNVLFEELSLKKITPKEVKLSNNNVIVSSWLFEKCRIEFLKFNFIPDIPSEMKVSECFIGIWRLQAFENGLKFIFECNLETASQIKLESYSEPGEGLTARSWENSDIKLTIGSEDEDYLIRRALAAKWMPYQFASQITSEAIDCAQKGIAITLPELSKGEFMQTHFIVAWSTKNSPETSTWYAVDQSPFKILNQANIEPF